MDKQQICKIWTARRAQLNKTWLEVTFDTKMDSCSLRKYFNSLANVWITTPFKINDSLKLTFRVLRKGKGTVIDSEKKLLEWANETFEESGMSKGDFAEALGLSRNSMPSNLSGKTKMRIDTFLKWAKLTGYTVLLTPKP